MQNEQFEYEVNNGKITITKYIGTGGEVIVPPDIDGKSVVKIGEHAFADCGFLTSVGLPSDTINIADNAFENSSEHVLYVYEQSNNEEAETNEETNEEVQSAEGEANNSSFSFDFEAYKSSNAQKETKQKRFRSNHSKLVSADFRQPFHRKQCVHPELRKGSFSCLIVAFFNNLLGIFGILLGLQVLIQIISIGLSGLITIGWTKGLCLTDFMGTHYTENSLIFIRVMIFVPLLVMIPFFTGFIRVMYAMILKRPYSWKIIFSGFDGSILGILITYILLYANIFLGVWWIAYSTEILNLESAGGWLPPLLINLPIAFYLLVAIAIQAGERCNPVKAIGIATQCIRLLIDVPLFLLYEIVIGLICIDMLLYANHNLLAIMLASFFLIFYCLFCRYLIMLRL